MTEFNHKGNSQDLLNISKVNNRLVVEKIIRKISDRSKASLKKQLNFNPYLIDGITLDSCEILEILETDLLSIKMPYLRGLTGDSIVLYGDSNLLKNLNFILSEF